MSDTPEEDKPQRAPFAEEVPPAPEPQHEEDEGFALPTQALNDQPTRDPRATHVAMSTEQLAELGYDEDGNMVEEPTDPEDGGEAASKEEEEEL